MNRRRYLTAAAGTVGLGASLSGCAALGGETVLEAPVERRDGRSIRFVYERGGEALVRIYFNRDPDTPWKAVNREPTAPGVHRLRTLIEQPADTTLGAYRVRFDTESTDGPAANVYLHPPLAGETSAFDTHRDAGWTTVEAEYDGGRRVTTGFEVLVYGDGGAADADADAGAADDGGGEGGRVPLPVLVHHELTLAGDGYLGESFVAADRTTIELGGSD